MKRIAWQNPITKDLTSAIIPVGNAFFDCVSNKLMYDINTTAISTGIGSTTLNGNQYWNFIFNRVLSVTETNALLADPFQIFSLERSAGASMMSIGASELRLYSVPVEDRKHTIAVEDRKHTITAENRSFKI